MLVAREAHQLCVKRSCASCKQRGVRAGMSLVLAQALAPGALVRRFNHQRDLQLLQKLAHRCYRLSPIVGIESEIEDPRADPIYTGILIDITGTERIYSNEEALLTDISIRLERAKLSVRCAIAPSIGAAWALARFSEHSHTITARTANSAEIRATLAQLPVAALRLNPHILESLESIGIEQIGQLFMLPRKKLAVRFGVELITRIDQALGYATEQIKPVLVSQPLVIHKVFEPYLFKTEAVHLAVVKLLQFAFEKLSSRGMLVAGFEIVLEQIEPSGKRTTCTKELPLAYAINTASALKSVISAALDSLLIHGEVKSITIIARHLQRAVAKQMALTTDGSNDIPLAAKQDLLNNLTLRLRPERINTLELRPSYIPEDSFSYRGLNQANTATTSEQPVSNVLTLPPYLLNPPEPIQAIAMLPDHPPAALRWNQASHKVIAALPAAKVSTEWWRHDLSVTESSTRDYFAVQDDSGRWLWIYRDTSSQQWFVHGLWI